MIRTLVIYYSRSGTTQAIAAEIASKLGADIASIEENRPRHGTAGYWRSMLEAVRGSCPVIEPIHIDLSQYGLVVLGTPVWAGHVSSPMRRFLRDHAQSLHAAAFFCSCGGRGFNTTFDDMSELLGKVPIATLAVRHRDLEPHRLHGLIDRFMDNISDVKRWANILDPGKAATAPDARPL